MKLTNNNLIGNKNNEAIKRSKPFKPILPLLASLAVITACSTEPSIKPYLISIHSEVEEQDSGSTEKDEKDSKPWIRVKFDASTRPDSKEAEEADEGQDQAEPEQDIVEQDNDVVESEEADASSLPELPETANDVESDIPFIEVEQDLNKPDIKEIEEPDVPTIKPDISETDISTKPEVEDIDVEPVVCKFIGDAIDNGNIELGVNFWKVTEVSGVLVVVDNCTELSYTVTKSYPPILPKFSLKINSIEVPPTNDVKSSCKAMPTNKPYDAAWTYFATYDNINYKIELIACTPVTSHITVKWKRTQQE